MDMEYDYLLKVNLAFVLFYAFYRLFFYKDTFFKLRRVILLLFFVIGFTYPLINIYSWLVRQPILLSIASISSVTLPEVLILSQVKASGWAYSFSNIVFYTYVVGVLIYSIRFLMQLFSVVHLKNQAKRAMINSENVYQLSTPTSPFSFFKMIFIHPQSHRVEEISEIMAHELTHAKQWHTVDVLISEMITIVCWFNPFVWLLRREVRYNLEYLADQHVITAGFDTKCYQYHLLGLAQYSSNVYLYNNFNMLHLKNRILMMNTKRTTRLGIVKYFMLAPLAAILMVACSGEMKSNSESAAKTEETTPAPVAEPVQTTEKPSTPSADEGAVFSVTEVMPQFPGGDSELMKFISKSVNYPKVAQDKGIQGRVVCSFVINKDGSIVDIQVLKAVDPALDEEAVRVIKSMPKWTPGKQKGEVVRVKYTIPIMFRLQ